MNLLLNATIGFFIGILMTIPLGPITLFVAQKTLQHETFRGLFVSLGSVVIDIVYCLVITLGLISLVAPYLQNTYVQVGLCIVLFVYGVRMLLVDGKRKIDVNASPQERNGRWYAAILLGITMAVANPTLFISWTAVLGTLTAWGLLGTAFWEKIVFSGATGVGSFAWFLTLALFVRSRRHSLSPAFIRNTGKVMAVLVMGFALYFSINILSGQLPVS